MEQRRRFDNLAARLEALTSLLSIILFQVSKARLYIDYAMASPVNRIINYWKFDSCESIGTLHASRVSTAKGDG
jgi:hypothetical protein